MSIYDINSNKKIHIEKDDIILLKIDIENYSFDVCRQIVQNWNKAFSENIILLDIGIKDYEIIKKGEQNEFLTRINR